VNKFTVSPARCDISSLQLIGSLTSRLVFGLWLANGLWRMSHRAKITRRKFIGITLTAAAGSPLVSCTGLTSPWRVLTAEEARTLSAICERLIPTDQDPGAAWAGVVNFIDNQLAGHYKKFRVRYRQGLAGTDQTSQILFGRRFTELDGRRQDEVLRALDEGHAQGSAWNRLSAEQFFDLVLAHTLQGFYGDPRHGGNREAVSWRMLGLPYPPILGRLRYDLSRPTGS
jgi:gluconate 2-dehydrogenase gamma chain